MSRARTFADLATAVWTDTVKSNYKTFTESQNS